MMNNNMLIALGVLLAIFLVILIASVGIGLYILINKNPDIFKKSQKQGDSTEIELVNAEVLNAEVLEENCINHPNINAEALCAICMGAFCERCIIADEKLNFCTKHYKLFTDNKWEKLEEIRTTPEEAQASEYLYKFKNSYWKEKQVPMIIVTHYQINVDADQIESEISLLAPEVQISELKDQLALAKKTH